MEIVKFVKETANVYLDLSGTFSSLAELSNNSVQMHHVVGSWI
ncbi:hypothetical protein [Clostridioides difficile]